jgi:hypothetical protein
MAQTAQMAPFTYDTVMKRLKASAKAAAKTCTCLSRGLQSFHDCVVCEGGHLGSLSHPAGEITLEKERVWPQVDRAKVG